MRALDVKNVEKGLFGFGKLTFLNLEKTLSMRILRLYIILTHKPFLWNQSSPGKTDPYIVIYKKYNHPEVVNTHLVPVYSSETKYDHLNPLWKEATVNLETFCDNNLHAPMIIKLFDRDKKKSTFIGQIETTVKQITTKTVMRGKGNADRTRAMYFIGEDEVQAKDNDMVGTLLVLKATEKNDLLLQ